MFHLAVKRRPLWAPFSSSRLANFRFLSNSDQGIRYTSPADQAWLIQNRANPQYNVPLHIESKIGRNLHLMEGNPINTISRIVQKFLREEYTCTLGAHHISQDSTSIRPDIGSPHGKMTTPNELPTVNDFAVFDNISPIVTIDQNFDLLGIPKNHVSRLPSDTYYVNSSHLLRCHTSAHQVQFIKRCNNPGFLVVGDVYRRDTIDTCHFPVFHQMEGVRIFRQQDYPHIKITRELVIQDLKHTLECLARRLFGSKMTQIRWIDAFFPFTDVSFEMEIQFNNEWLEVLGCGSTAPSIISNAGEDGEMVHAWAFGLGLERLAMILFSIPDIRLFWCEDERFLRQFRDTNLISKFKPFSSQPACFKDLSFWIPESYHENDFYDLIRIVAENLVEDVVLIDQFYNTELKKKSHCYRLNFRSMDRTLTNREVDQLQHKIRAKVVKELDVILR